MEICSIGKSKSSILEIFVAKFSHLFPYIIHFYVDLKKVLIWNTAPVRHHPYWLGTEINGLLMLICFCTRPDSICSQEPIWARSCIPVIKPCAKSLWNQQPPLCSVFYICIQKPHYGTTARRAASRLTLTRPLSTLTLTCSLQNIRDELAQTPAEI